MYTRIWEFNPGNVNFLHVMATALVGAVGLLLCFFFKYAYRRYVLSKSLPGTKPWFFDLYGDLRTVESIKKNRTHGHFNSAMVEFVKMQSKKYRKNHLACAWVSYVPFIQIFTAEAIEELIAGTRSMKKGWIYTFLHPWLGTGLLTSYGPKWKSRRKLLTPSFHFDILKEFLPIFNEQAQTFVHILKNETGKDYTDIVMPVTLCSLDIICETTLGVKINAQENQNSEYVKAVLRAAQTISERMINGKYWIDAIFNFTEVGSQLNKDIKLLHSFTRKVIKEKKQKLLSGELTIDGTKKRKALMDVLLEHHVKTKELSEEDIREEVDTFTFEGHDTTSMGISWALYLIGLYKEVQEKLFEEIDRIFGDDTERPISTDDLKDMSYLDCVLKESQRLYPSVPSIAREATEDIEICGYKIPKGTLCSGIIYEIHRDERVYPDPEKFDPERFLPENTANRHPYAYIPFSAGPRNCIGQRFAQMEEKVVVANILRNFSLQSLDSRDNIILSTELILRSLTPIRIKFNSRGH